MACVNLAMEVTEDRSARPEHQDDVGPLIQHYRVAELLPDPELPLHHLLKREPATWAAVQISSGILSIGVGVIAAASFKIDSLLLTLFRVPIITGIMFLIAGFLSVMLYRNPGLLQMCFHSNIFCLVVAAIGAVLLCVDLGRHLIRDLPHWMEILVLCVTLLDMLVSVVLIFMIIGEKRRCRKK